MKATSLPQQQSRFRSSARLLLIPLLVSTGLRAADSLTPPVLQPGAAVDYSKLAFNPERWEQRGLSTQLVPWFGKQTVFLTTRSNLDYAVMGRFVGRLDAGWQLYADLTGRSPRLFKQLDAKATIAAVPDVNLTCGVGCGLIGATGVEIAAFYDRSYPLMVVHTNAFPQLCFYEIGRNFYTFGERHSLFITGFAVFMRYVCMDTLGCEDPDPRTRETIEQAEELYAKSDMGFLKAFTTLDGLGEKAPRIKGADGKWLHPSDQNVMYASAMLKLRRDCGGNAWVKRFFAELTQCPGIKPDSPDAALRQSTSWLVAASCAARRDLSPLFADRWRLPMSPETRHALAAIAWSNPDTEASRVLKQLPPPKVTQDP
jgi:hypothetical protein